MKRCLSDLRSPPKWKLADYKRDCERVICSILWQRAPFGMRNIPAFPNVQPGVWREASGKPVGGPGTLNAEWGAFIDSDPSRSLLAGKPLLLWGSPTTERVTAVDLTRLDNIDQWVELLIVHFGPWAAGILHDYLTTLAWIDAVTEPDPTKRIPDWYWRAWNTGYALALTKLKARRPDWLLLGQQYHPTELTPYVGGLYVEEYPTRSGVQLWQHEAHMNARGDGAEWVMEIRDPDALDPAHVALYLDFIERMGCYVSWRREAEALVGLPR